MEKGFIIRSGEFDATTGLTSFWIWSILIGAGDSKYETKISNPKPKTLNSK
jgi:hypothetical protein